MKKKIIVIGSGIGGLAAACRLAALGHDVDIFEQCDKPGGRAAVSAFNGFKFDGVPGAISAPFLIDDIFAAAGRRREDYFRLLPVDPFYRIFNGAGKSFDYKNDPAFTLSEIDKWNPADRECYSLMSATTARIEKRAFASLAARPLLSEAGMLTALPTLLNMHSFDNPYAFASGYLSNEFLRSVFSIHPLLVGGNPFESSSIYALSRELERQGGLWAVEGGSTMIIGSLVRLFGDLGGKLHTRAAVTEILTNRRRVTGVRLASGSIHAADVVISNADPASTYTKLIKPAFRQVNDDARYRRQEYSLSLFVIQIGTRRGYFMPAADGGAKRELAHHNLILSTRHSEAMAAIFDRRELPQELTVYLHMPRCTDLTSAPEGCETLTIEVPVPNLEAKIDWTKSARPFRDRVLQFVEANFLPGLRANTAAEHVHDPLYFQNTLGCYHGAVWSLRPLALMSALSRPQIRSEDFDNLYLTGTGTHPGAGLPGILCSAVIVERLIQDSR